MSITFSGITFPLSRRNTRNWPNQIKEITLPGVDGEGGLDMGKRKRPLRVRGRLPDSANGTPNSDDIEELNSGATGTLVIHGKSYPNCRVAEASCDDFCTATIDGVATETCLYEILFEQMQE